MLKHKNALIAVAAAALLAACGGGGGDSSTGNDPGTNPSGGNNAVVDKKVAGFMQLTQVAVNDRLFSYDQDFQGTGIFGQAMGTVAPFKTFGLRLTQINDAVASGNGHVGIELIDTAAGTPQKMQLVVDRVNYAIDGSGKWTVSVPTTAKLYIYVKNRNGGEANLTVTDPQLADLVKAIPVGQVDPTVTDPNGQVLTVDVDKAFVTAKGKASAADKAVLDSMQQFSGSFNLNASFSALTIRFGATATSPKVDGVNITVGGETANGSGEAGSGVKGKFRIDA